MGNKIVSEFQKDRENNEKVDNPQSHSIEDSKQVTQLETKLIIPQQKPLKEPELIKSNFEAKPLETQIQLFEGKKVELNINNKKEENSIVEIKMIDSKIENSKLEIKPDIMIKIKEEPVNKEEPDSPTMSFGDPGSQRTESLTHTPVKPLEPIRSSGPVLEKEPASIITDDKAKTDKSTPEFERIQKSKEELKSLGQGSAQSTKNDDFKVLLPFVSNEKPIDLIDKSSLMQEEINMSAPKALVSAVNTVLSSVNPFLGTANTENQAKPLFVFGSSASTENAPIKSIDSNPFGQPVSSNPFATTNPPNPFSGSQSSSGSNPFVGSQSSQQQSNTFPANINPQANHYTNTTQDTYTSQMPIPPSQINPFQNAPSSLPNPFQTSTNAFNTNPFTSSQQHASYKPVAPINYQNQSGPNYQSSQPYNLNQSAPFPASHTSIPNPYPSPYNQNFQTGSAGYHQNNAYSSEVSMTDHQRINVTNPFDNQPINTYNSTSNQGTFNLGSLPSNTQARKIMKARRP